MNALGKATHKGSKQHFFHVSHVAVLQLEMHFSTYASLMIKGLSWSYEWENIQLLPERVKS